MQHLDTILLFSGSFAILMAAATALMHRRDLHRLFNAAIKEQHRREADIKARTGIEFRHDQRMAMIQARLSRRLGGKRAMSMETRYRIEKYLKEHKHALQK